MAFDGLISKLETQNSIVGNIGLYSYGTAFFAFTVLIILATILRRNSPIGNALLAASILTALWAATVSISTLFAKPTLLLIQLTEAALKSPQYLFYSNYCLCAYKAQITY